MKTEIDQLGIHDFRNDSEKNPILKSNRLFLSKSHFAVSDNSTAYMCLEDCNLLLANSDTSLITHQAKLLGARQHLRCPRRQLKRQSSLLCERNRFYVPLQVLQSRLCPPCFAAPRGNEREGWFCVE